MRSNYIFEEFDDDNDNDAHEEILDTIRFLQLPEDQQLAEVSAEMDILAKGIKRLDADIAWCWAELERRKAAKADVKPVKPVKPTFNLGTLLPADALFVFVGMVMFVLMVISEF